MPKGKKENNKSSKSEFQFWIYLWDFIWFYLRAIYYILKSPFYLARYLNNKQSKISLAKSGKRQGIASDSDYLPFKVLSVREGSVRAWEDKIRNSDSTIGIIVGARGSGKTAFGVRLLENLYKKHEKKCYALGFNEEDMPSWINVVDDTKLIENDSYVLIDEGGVLFSSRRAMSNANKMLSDLLLISRHKNLSIIFIAQNSSNLDVNIIRQADYLVLKQAALLQKNFERKIIRDIYQKSEKDFSKYGNDKSISYVYSDSFNGFIKNGLPSFWSSKISKSFANKK